MRRIIGGVFLLVMFVLLGCAGDAPVSDTGFNGSWGKTTGSLDVAMYIWNDGERYRFRMMRESLDGTGRITCDWEGRCSEYVRDRQTSDFRFWLESTGDPGRLLLHCRGRVTYPEELEISYIHELSLSDDGLELISHTVESQGIRYEGDARGRRTLSKISDKVPDPPAAAP